MAETPDDPKPPATIQGTSSLGGPVHNPANAPATFQGRSSLGPSSLDIQAELEERGRQRERAAHWVRDNFKRSACAVCGSNNWQIGDVYSLAPFRNRSASLVVEATMPQPPALPVFPVTCNVCGNTVFINAVLSGVVKGIGGSTT